ncbi:hypothetical protein HFP57_17495 [Parasphingopyxis algicola]|uniref:hypothetical protein n=1 Tax=Parasphingopyxis algicola TaxID=2026624 RepID=UPI0015A0A59D|nr:hypothetical protein [Parasphingopyxis algicola]QLC26652.1 hypothetical protein HFP57_17495 [Parasphingopyxis algicola]
MKINLFCGPTYVDGFVNVDHRLEYSPDDASNLTEFPWPWDDNSVEEVQVSHALEFLYESKESYFSFWKELYRVCKTGAKVTLQCYHPHSDEFRFHPERTRPIYERGLQQLLNTKRSLNLAGDTPFSLKLGIAFSIVDVEHDLTERFHRDVKVGKRTMDDVLRLADAHNNVIRSSRYTLQAEAIEEPFQEHGRA